MSRFTDTYGEGRLVGAGGPPPGAVLGQYHGREFGGGRYRVHDAESVTVFGTVLEMFPGWAGRVVPFGFDWLGRQFALDAGADQVLLFEPGTGEVVEIPVGLERFHDEEPVDEADARRRRTSSRTGWRRPGRHRLGVRAPATGSRSSWAARTRWTTWKRSIWTCTGRRPRSCGWVSPVPDAAQSPELRAALRVLRQVRSEQPGGGPGADAFAAWRSAVADALESLAPLLLFPEDRQRAADEARRARAEAARLRDLTGGRRSSSCECGETK